MFRMTLISLIFGMVFPLSAQLINVSGTVTNRTSGKPVVGAVITLHRHNLSAETDAQGVFSLSGIFVVDPSPILPNIEKISFNSRVVILNLTKSSPVKIELFNMRGNLLGKVVDQPASAGVYRFDVMSHPMAAKMMIVRVAIGKHSSSFRCLSLSKGSRTVASSGAVSSGGGRLAKTKEAIDTLVVGAPNYHNNIVPIASYEETSVNVTLDSNTTGLDKFSFFVTSLKALQDLSGSDSGFGGDLRFGKTGPGAGLLGADSICQCIAERSMPGSKVKKWRAFLSVHKGPDGNPVHARDRIGQGPWYDRVGRLIANDLNDLLKSRPNADPEIKNDLPNEDGIPNHQPDPAKPAVDNHLTVTGSDYIGMLYIGRTTNFGGGRRRDSLDTLPEEPDSANAT